MLDSVIDLRFLEFSTQSQKMNKKRVLTAYENAHLMCFNGVKTTYFYVLKRVFLSGLSAWVLRFEILTNQHFRQYISGISPLVSVLLTKILSTNFREPCVFGCEDYRPLVHFILDFLIL